MHERAHEQGEEWRDGIRICRGLPVRSLRLGLNGIVDVVEFHPRENGPSLPFPVEYKRGRPKPDRSDEVQLCAQALCLEEMLKVEVPSGAIFYGQPRRRMDVAFDASLREETEATAARLHALHIQQRTPIAVYSRKCDRCSLLDLCLPESTGTGRSVASYVRRAVATNLADREEG